ncbi:MAG: NUDIX domain-containing protein [Erythrobacter sp.]|nr:MAG: NUDIX domain-containing protein [Erythrobacter sp.]
MLGQLWSKTLHFFFRVSRGLTIGVRAVVRSHDGKFLLVRHTYTPGWHLPGGGVEPGETMTQALEKELKEETNLGLVGKPVLHGVFFNHHVSKHDHVLVYLCEVSGSIPQNSPDREIAELSFFDLNQLPEDMDQGTERRLREIAEGQAPAMGW